MTLLDFYKVNYQAFFGAEHLIADTANVLLYIQEELPLVNDSMNIPDIEKVGKYRRVSLRLIANNQISAQNLANAFIKSGQPVQHPEGTWLKQWMKIEHRILSRYPNIEPGFDPGVTLETARQLLLEGAAKNQPAHHSQIYRTTYQPHYRIIHKSLLHQLTK